MRAIPRSLLIVALVAMLVPAGSMAADENVLLMSTTTSTQASGLLDVLLPAFTAETGIQVKVFAKGTGAAIRDGIDGNVDVLFVHDPDKEAKFVADGFGTKRYAVMHNDFVIVGPKSDPAKIAGEKSAVQALKKIAATALFVSRGDDSGTHAKEQVLWKASSLELASRKGEIAGKSGPLTFEFTWPASMQERYLSIGQGMDKVLLFADEKQAYALADRGTFIEYKHGKSQGLDLEILCQGDSPLFNPYGVIPVNPAKFPHVKFELAERFCAWITGAKGQALIAGYKVNGEQLFFPDAR